MRPPNLEMASYYAHVVAALKIPNDAALVESMNTANKKILAELEAKIVDAEENLGETELSEALIAKAEHFSRIGDKVLIYNLGKWACCL